MLPLYERLGMDKRILACVASMAAGVNFLPWTGPMLRASAALHIPTTDALQAADSRAGRRPGVRLRRRLPAGHAGGAAARRCRGRLRRARRRARRSTADDAGAAPAGPVLDQRCC